ncbi:MAG: O-antigen ligase family protein [Leptospirales bacterium]|nr:O-antigen ligase family protein [Leptospirales bacterium]
MTIGETRQNDGRHVWRLVQSALFAALVIASLGAHTQFVAAREIGAAFVFYGFWIILALRRAAQQGRTGPGPATALFLLTAAAGATIHALSRNVETGIPSLRLIFRASFHFYAWYMIYSALRGRDRMQMILEFAVWFGSFPYLWASVWNPAGVMPLLLGVAGSAIESRKTLRETLLFLHGSNRLLASAGVIAAISLTLAFAFSSNSLQGWNQVCLWSLGVLVVLCTIARVQNTGWREIIRPLWIHFVCFAALQFVALVIMLLEDGEGAALLTKKLGIAGLNANDASAFVLLYLPLFCATLIYASNRLLRFAALLSMILAVLLALATGSRTSILLILPLLLAVVAFAAIRRYRPQSRLLQSTLGAAAILAAALMLGAVALRIRPLHFSENSSLALRSMQERAALWTQAKDLLHSYPYLGTGPHSFSAIGAHAAPGLSAESREVLATQLQQSGLNLHVHSLLLQSALDGGPPFAAAIYLGLCAVIALAWRSASGKPFAIGLALALLSVPLQGMINYHFMHAHYVIMVAALIGASIQMGAPALLPLRELPPLYARRGIVLSLALAATAISIYFAALAVAHGRIIDRLGSRAHLGAAGAWVVEGPPAPSELPRIRQALRWSQLGRRLAPLNPEFAQLQGAILVHLAGAFDQTAAAEAALEPLHHCALHAAMPAYCYRLTATALQLSRPANDPAIARAEELARAFDPFELVEKGYVRPY